MRGSTIIRKLAVAMALAASLALAPAAQAGLVAYYNFDAGNANDLSANANHGAAGASITYQTDTFSGNGLAARNYGTGGANVITVATSPSLEAIDDAFTISFWMKGVTGNNWVRIFQHGTEGNPSQTWLVDRYSNTNNTNVRVDTMGTGGQFNQNIAVSPAAPVFDDVWHHVAFSVSNGQWAKYMDGVLLGTGTYKHGDGLDNTRPLYIFGKNGGGDYVGMLDDIALWDERIDARRMAAIAGLAKFEDMAPTDPEIDAVLALTNPGEGVAAGSNGWFYTELFPTPPSGSLRAGMHYVGPLGFEYIVLEGNATAGFKGVRTTPEPATLSLLALGGLGLLARRRRR